MSKWKERIPGIVISVILVAVFAVFMVILLQSKMVPTKLLILGGIALVLLVASAVLLVRSIRRAVHLRRVAFSGAGAGAWSCEQLHFGRDRHADGDWRGAHGIYARSGLCAHG